jgi:hypothetical protein
MEEKTLDRQQEHHTIPYILRFRRSVATLGWSYRRRGKSHPAHPGPGCVDPPSACRNAKVLAELSCSRSICLSCIFSDTYSLLYPTRKHHLPARHRSSCSLIRCLHLIPTISHQQFNGHSIHTLPRPCSSMFPHLSPKQSIHDDLVPRAERMLFSTVRHLSRPTWTSIPCLAIWT